MLAFGASYALLETSSLLADFAAHIRLIREENAPLGTIFVVPPQSIVEKRKLDKSGIKKEASVVINEFVSTLEKEGIALDNLYRRFQPHSVQPNLKLAGQYQPSTGILYVDTNNLRETLLRALLEETITFDEDKKFIAHGFERINYDSRENEKIIEHFGYGMNETYKQLFMARHFDLPIRDESLVSLLRMIEEILGTTKLEDVFLTGNLVDLIHSFMSFHTTSTFKRWIKSFDRAYTSLHRGQSYSLSKNNSLLKQLGVTCYRGLFLEIAENYIRYIKRIAQRPGGALTADILLARLDQYLFIPSGDKNPSDYKLKSSDVEAIRAYRDEMFPHRKEPSYVIRPKDSSSIK